MLACKKFELSNKKCTDVNETFLDDFKNIFKEFIKHDKYLKLYKSSVSKFTGTIVLQKKKENINPKTIKYQNNLVQETLSLLSIFKFQSKKNELIINKLNKIDFLIKYVLNDPRSLISRNHSNKNEGVNKLHTSIHPKGSSNLRHHEGLAGYSVLVNNLGKEGAFKLLCQAIGIIPPQDILDRYKSIDDKKEKKRIRSQSPMVKLKYRKTQKANKAKRNIQIKNFNDDKKNQVFDYGTNNQENLEAKQLILEKLIKEYKNDTTSVKIKEINPHLEDLGLDISSKINKAEKMRRLILATSGSIDEDWKKKK
jgi:hypothetical protein